jgi:hypothetical protein
LEWKEFLQWIAVPAGGLLLAFIGWAYLDGRDSIRQVARDSAESAKSLAASLQSLDSKYAAELVALRAQMQAMLLEVAKGYVPKDDLEGTERRIMASIGELKNDMRDWRKEVRDEAIRISR